MILPVQIEPITPELLDKFKASGEWILAHTVSEFWDGKAPAKEFNNVMMMRWDGDFWTDNDVIYDEPTHYLPDGLPDPSQAVEVFESEVECEVSVAEYGEFYGTALVQLDADKFQDGDRVRVRKVKGVTPKQKREQYIRASDKRVSQWMPSKQEAFRKAVERITGEKTNAPE